MREYKKTICPLDCPDTCGLIATLEDGRVVALQGDPDHPYTRGVICRKMKGYPARLHGSERILHPLIRVGAKGAADFKQISWSQAWDYLSTRLANIIDSHGGEAVLPYCYAGNMGLINRFAGFPLFHRIGASKLEQTICSATAGGGWKHICGAAGGTPPEHAADADLIVIWGMNVKVSNLHFWPYVVRARKRGARLLVIDPYRNDTARSSDEHIWVRPGGDAALALGILKLMVANEWLDDAFIGRCSSGFDELQAYLQATAMEDFEAQSNVGRATMERLACLFFETPKTFVRIGVGLTRNSRGAMAIRAIGSLAAACGFFNGKQGQGVLLFSKAFGGDTSLLKMEALGPDDARVINMIHLGEALTSLDPPVKAMLVYNSNPLCVAPDASMVRKGLTREDLFTVVHEQVMTPTARYADLVLPATTFLENRDLYTAYGHFYLGIAEPVIEPLGESLSNFDFFQTLAQKLGYSEEPFRQSFNDRLESYFNSLAELPEGLSYSGYRPGEYVLSKNAAHNGCPFGGAGNTFRFVNAELPELSRHPLLSAAKEFDNPDLKARFPFRLLTPPNDRLLNSTFGERYAGESGTVLIHPDDAADRSINDGAPVRLANLRGTVTRVARVSDDTQPGLLVAEGLYWPSGAGGETINDLTSQQCSDIGGGAIFHEALVDINPLPQGR
jgi:anaerobic selenocysteine-containing dehydrogenase